MQADPIGFIRADRPRSQIVIAPDEQHPRLDLGDHPAESIVGIQNDVLGFSRSNRRGQKHRHQDPERLLLNRFI